MKEDIRALESKINQSAIKCSINWKAVVNSSVRAGISDPSGNCVFIHPKATVPETVDINIGGANNLVYIGPHCFIEGGVIEVKGQHGILVIGSRVRTRDGHIKLSGRKSSVVLGWHTTWGGGQLLASEGEGIFVGDDCMFSSNITIRTSDSHGIFDRNTGKRLNDARSVFVEDHVWVGNGARVNKGTRIARGSVIGQASVVSGSLLTPSSIYAGVPAKLLREDIVWSRTGSISDAPADLLGYATTGEA